VEDTQEEQLIAHLRDAHLMLIKSLTEVRQQREPGADDWRYRLLRTFHEYLIAIGIRRELIDPVQAMIFESGDGTLIERRRKAGKTGTPMPSVEAACMTMASAAVTVLRERRALTMSMAP
jgi:hypothetical protein